MRVFGGHIGWNMCNIPWNISGIFHKLVTWWNISGILVTGQMLHRQTLHWGVIIIRTPTLLWKKNRLQTCTKNVGGGFQPLGPSRKKEKRKAGQNNCGSEKDGQKRKRFTKMNKDEQKRKEKHGKNKKTWKDSK